MNESVSCSLSRSSQILFVLLFFLLASEGQGKYSCDPATDCSTSLLGDMVPDPYDCQNYYLCVSGPNGTIIPSDDFIPCPEDQYFDQNTGECEDENGVPCQDLCLNMCTTNCEEINQMIFYPGDCTKYYICTNSSLLIAKCPDGTYFDGNECSDNVGDCCDNCTPYCYESFIEVEDPNNCVGYYICSSEGIPSEEDYHTCDDGQYFEPSIGLCNNYDNPNDTCQSLCSSDTNAYACDPDYDCLNLDAGSKVPDPYDCHNYYVCIIDNSGDIVPVEDPIPCPDNQFFSQTTGECENENGVPCQDTCLNMCYTNCEGNEESIFYPGDCTKYYLCVENDQIMVQCPNGTYFNGSACSENSGDCCDNCTPFCEEAFQLVSDPNNCESYYLCRSRGIPSENDHYDCNDGQYFEEDIGMCNYYVNSSNICQPLCPIEIIDYTCNPEDDCSNLTSGAKVPDPNSCHNYYLCVKGDSGNIVPSDSPITCPDNQYFSQTTGDCENENGVQCQDLCLNMCYITCEENYDFLFYPGDCTKYYICFDNEILTAECPTGTYFNGSGCSENSGDCCDNCTPYCEKANVEVMDPYDCESYYICTSKGIPSSENHYECDDGQYFESSIGLCNDYNNSNENCQSLCTREFTEYSCEPDTDCENLDAGDMVPDPNNCHNYYLCIMESSGDIVASDFSSSCPEGQYFSQTTGGCEDENGIPCQDICLNMCHTSCEDDQPIFYPGNCKKYYACNNGNLTEMQCPGDTYFDGTGCSESIEDCCDNCSPYCDAPFQRVMDPNDCESYYTCTSKGIPDIDNHYQCEDGKYFDPSSSSCIDYSDTDEECESLCSDKSFTCDPYLDCNNFYNGSKVPDPYNCHNYYLCIPGANGNIVPTNDSLNCPDDQYFSQDIGECQDENGVTCQDLCLNMCPISCTYEYENIFYPGDCTKYYICVPDSGKVEANCGISKYFNGYDCSENVGDCCDNCKPYCDETLGDVADPSNCEGYYECTTVGIPTTDQQMQCIEGQYFNSSLGACQEYSDEQDTCQSLC